MDNLFIAGVITGILLSALMYYWAYKRKPIAVTNICAEILPVDKIIVSKFMIEVKPKKNSRELRAIQSLASQPVITEISYYSDDLCVITLKREYK